MNDQVKVRITWEKEEFEFEGKPSDVVIEIEKFLSQFIPQLSLARKLQISVDLRDIAEIVSPVIKLSGRDIILSGEASKFSLSDKILAVLTTRKLQHMLGEVENEFLTLKEISDITSSQRKSSSSRLSELYSRRLVDKRRIGGKVMYKVTVNGIISLKKRIDRLRMK